MKTRKITTLILFCFVSVVMIWGNTIVKDGGVVDSDTLMDENHFLNQMEIELFGSEESGGLEFEGTEALAFVYSIDKSLSRNDIDAVAQLHEKISDAMIDLGGVTASIANVDGFFETNDEMEVVEYTRIEDEDFSVEKWKKLIGQEKGLVPAFVDPAFEHVVFLVYPPRGYDRIEFYRAGVSFLEDREISKFEWFFKKDIKPVDSHFKTVGWVWGRGNISGALKIDAFMLNTVGMVLAFVVFLLYTRMLVPSVVASVLIGIAFIWMRGEIGLLNLFGVQMSERVFTLLAYVPNLVQGVSFFVHMIVSYKKGLIKDPDTSIEQAWIAARKATVRAIAVVAVIAVGGFGNLMIFPILPLWEVGLISIIGIVNLLLLAFFALPALHCTFSRWDRQISFGNFDLDVQFERITVVCSHVVGKLAVTHVFVLMLMLGTVVVYGVSQNWLKMGGSPIEYIKTTWTGQSARYMNQDDKTGNTAFEFFLTPVDDFVTEADSVLYDPAFSMEAWQFVKRIKEIEGVREVHGIFDTMERISTQSFDRPFPDTNQLLGGIFMMYIDSSLESELRKQYYDNFTGYRITVTTGLEGTQEWRRICDEILFHLSKDLSSVKVVGFGDMLKYVYSDHIIIEDMPMNIASDSVVIFAIIFCMVFVILGSTRKIGRRIMISIGIGTSAVIPFIFSLLCLIIVMMACGISLEISTALIVPATIAASIDFAVYLIEKFMILAKTMDSESAVEMAIKEKGSAIIADCVINQVLFLPLVFSNFLPIQRIGWMLVIMLLFAVVGSLVLMPPVMRKVLASK